MTKHTDTSPSRDELAAPLADQIEPSATPAIDRPEATARPGKERLRGAGGQFVAKNKAGAPAKNTNRVTHGRRRAKTSRGCAANKDRFDRVGVEYARRIWKRYGYPASPLKSALATKHAIAMRLHDQVGNSKPATRDGKLRGHWQNYTQAAGERDRLLERLECRFRPDVGVARPDEENQFVHIVHFSDGTVMGTTPGRNGETQETMIAQAERDLAIKNLKGGDLPTDVSHVSAWWSGRLWSGYQQGMRVAHFEGEDGGVAMRVDGLDTEVATPSPQLDAPAESDAEVSTQVDEPATHPAPLRAEESPPTSTNGDAEPNDTPVEKEPQRLAQPAPPVTEPAPQPPPPTNIRPYLNSAAHIRDRDLR